MKDSTLPNKIIQTGLEALPQEERDELLAEMGEIIFGNVMRRAYASLSLTQQDVMNHLLEESAADPTNEKKYQALATFLQEQVPEFDTYAREELEVLQKRQEQALEDLD